MPAKKKGGIDIFMHEYRLAHFSHMNCSDMVAINAGRKAWKNLSMAEKESYEMRAKKMSRPRGSEYQRTGFGETVAVATKRGTDRITWRHNVSEMFFTIIDSVKSASSGDEFLQQPYVFCFSQGVEIKEAAISRRTIYVPLEIALLKFTLESGIVDILPIFPQAELFIDDDSCSINTEDKEHALSLQLSDLTFEASGNKVVSQISDFCKHNNKTLPIFTYDAHVSNLYSALAQLVSNFPPTTERDPFYTMPHLEPPKSKALASNIPKDVTFCHYEEMDDMPFYWRKPFFQVLPVEVLVSAFLIGTQQLLTQQPSSVDAIISGEAYAKRILEATLPLSLCGIDACSVHQSKDASNSCCLKQATVSIVAFFDALHSLKSPYTASLGKEFVSPETYDFIREWMRSKQEDDIKKAKLMQAPAVAAPATSPGSSDRVVNQLNTQMRTLSMGRGHFLPRLNNSMQPGINSRREKNSVPSFVDSF